MLKCKKPEKRATEAWEEELQRFRGALFLATFRDTLDAPNQLQNESRNRLLNGPET